MRIGILTALAFLLFGLVFWLPRPSPAGGGAQATLAIEGMTCAGCATALAVQLRRTEGVAAAEVSYPEARAVVTYDPAVTSPKEIAAAVARSGFAATVLTSIEETAVSDPSRAGEQAAPSAATATATQGAPLAPAAAQCHPRSAAGVGGADCCGMLPGGPASVEPEAAGLISLSESEAPLVSAFNEAAGRPRFLTILSPTCPACVHGGRAIEAALAASGSDLEVFVVWAPMLGSDSAAAATEISSKLTLPGARQYWDSERRIGTALRRDLFPEAVAQMRSSMPPGHFLGAYLEALQPDLPEWDIYLLFDERAHWGERAPSPAAWVRQMALYPGPDNGEPLSLVWRRADSQPPVEGSLTALVEGLISQADGGAIGES